MSNEATWSEIRSVRWFVELTLLDPLVLRMRGTKPAILRPCRCHVPSLDSTTGTMNQAYSSIARHFESWRQSSTGNVFKKLFYFSPADRPARWRRLDDLRQGAEADLEQRLFRPQTALSL